MNATAVHQEPDAAVFDANIAALAATWPPAAESLRSAAPPATLRFALGRDGAPTYAWTDGQGRLCWLGRTTMPSVRAPALVEAFEPGTRNVLFNGFGQGREAWLLLQRLAPHQAVMAVDEAAWAVALGLRLHDFADDLRRGRMPLFVGPDAWDALRDFLIAHDGYLTPERVLSWPWFDPGAIADVADRLSTIGTTVAEHRAAKHADVRHRRAGEDQRPASPTSAPARRPTRDAPVASPEARDPSHEPSIVILSNVPDPRVRRFAANLKAAADAQGWPCDCYVLDDPAMVHPRAIESALWEAAPKVVVLLDVAPDALQCEQPPVPQLVACTHGQPIASGWVEQLPPSAHLAVTTDEQRVQVSELGVDASRVLLLPPAAAAGIRIASGLTDREAGPTGILVVAEGHDTSPTAAGLHLASHCKLWEAATEIVRDRCDGYRDDQAEDVLRGAEKKLHIRIDSEEVRRGLVSRLRQVLGPVLVRRAYCVALAEARVDFDLYGGWAQDPILGSHDRGHWPGPPKIGDALSGHGLIVSLETSGRPQAALLDGIAGGLAAIVRAHPLDGTPRGLSAVLDPARHVRRFKTRRELVELVRQFQQRPADFSERSQAATRHVNAHHTWVSRLTAIVEAAQRG